MARTRIKYTAGEKVGTCIYLRGTPLRKKPNGDFVRMAIFKCSCGNEFEASIGNIKGGHTTSCGCYLKQKLTIHGLSGHVLYKVWYDMMSRCYNFKDAGYYNYGGRGITVYNEWCNDFKIFYDHVIQLPNYGEPGLTLDREKNDQGYFPENVRWVDMHIQSTNQRKRSDNTSGYTGVYKHRSNWSSRLYINGAAVLLGTYPTPEGAVEARNKYIIDNNLIEYKIQTF